MTKNLHVDKESLNHEKLDIWFDEFMGLLQMDKFLLKEDLASKETKNLYSILVDDNMEELMRISGSSYKKYFIQSIIKDYLVEINTKQINANKIAFDLGDSKVLSWVELSNGDEESEDKIIMLEAKLNAKYRTDGFNVSTMIVEESDHIPVPSHYHLVQK